jgi:hypothetical protein
MKDGKMYLLQRRRFIESEDMRITVSSDLWDGEDVSGVKTPDYDHRNLLNKSSILANKSWLRDRPLREMVQIKLHYNDLNMEEGFSMKRWRKPFIRPRRKGRSYFQRQNSHFLLRRHSCTRVFEKVADFTGFPSRSQGPEERRVFSVIIT